MYCTSQGPGAGLVAASMIAIVPGYISRSVAGSYDNEGIAIFCMLLTYFMWVKSVKTGSICWSTFCALAYFYMVIGINVEPCYHGNCTGVILGRLCVLNQFNSNARISINVNWKIFTPSLHCLLHCEDM